MRKGFTLIELLVAIGIIAVLLGLLFPVISKLKKSAYAASTAQTINSIQGSIQQYFAVFQNYPGMYDFNQPVGTRYAVVVGTFNYPTGVLPAAPAAGAEHITQAESLLLALTGGIKIGVNPTTFAITSYDYDATRLGAGPFSLNPRIPRQYQPFASGEIKTSVPSDIELYSGGIDDGDTNVPEFVDSFPDQRPILYARARRGAATTALQYPPANFGYGFGAVCGAGKEFTSYEEYYGDPSFTGGTTPRQKDQYMLISAGADGKFGTKDDITNFGTPGR